MMTLRRVALIGSVCLAATALHGQESSMTPKEWHDLLVKVIAQLKSSPIPAGDTSVGWYDGKPSYVTTARRTPEGIVSSFVRFDGMIGTAAAHWANGRQTNVAERWTKPDTAATEIQLTVSGGKLLISGSLSATLDLPSMPWVIADYGLDDQLVPLFGRIITTTRFAMYRPYLRKWDTVTVASRRVDGVLMIDETEPSGEIFTFALAEDGSILRVLSSKQTKIERRPLQSSKYWAAYVELP
jgi:hypothetical protein